MQAGCGGACCGPGEGEAGEGRHDDGLWRFGLFGFAEQEADAGAVDASGIGNRGLCDDDAGFAGRGNVGDCAELKTKAADVDGGGALALAEEIGDGDLLRAEAFGDAHGPLTADGGSSCGRLREDVAGWGVGGVEAIFEVEAEAEGAGLLAGVGEGEVGEVGDLDLAAVDGEAHRDEGGEERDDEHRQGPEDDIEEAVDAGDLHCSVRIYGVLSAGVLFRETAWLRLLEYCVVQIVALQAKMPIA